ncbi:MAG: phosphoenolpyruvate synthase [Promethearchaeota archaeon]
MKYIRFFEEVGKEDVGLVGGKNSSLGEMTRNLASLQVNVPYGFAVTVDAYSKILEENFVRSKNEKISLKEYIARKLNAIDHELKSEQPGDILVVKKTTIKIRKMIEKAQYPPELERQIIEAYEKLEEKTGGSVYAVRSSATAEDLPDASFAGQQDTYLNIFGEDEILEHILKCMASTFTTRATQYRQRAGFNHFDVKLSVAVQEMAGGLSGVRASGVMFSIDPDSGNSNFVTIRGTWGLGEMIVQGKEVGDEWKVFKHSPLGLQILSRTRVYKRVQLVTIDTAESAGYEIDQHIGTVEIPVPEDLQHRLCLTNAQVEQLAHYALAIEKHYHCPMDIEWVLGSDGNLYIVQARPETVESQRGDEEQIFYLLEDVEKLYSIGRILDESGVPIGRKIGSGPIKVIPNISEAWRLKKGDILVTEETNPDWTAYLEHLGGIITERGGPTCHAAIVSREQGIACIVGAEGVINRIEDFMNSENISEYFDENREPCLTVDCSQGAARIWRGEVAYDYDEIDFSTLPHTKTKIFVNLGIPDGALSAGKHPDGTGLARLEFIIGDEIQVHPKALINYLKLRKKLAEMKQQKITIEKMKGTPIGSKDRLAQDILSLEETLEKIDEAVEGYGISHSDFYIQKLAEGIATIAGAVWKELPDGSIAEAVVRMSDFKTNEYRGLLGGWLYETEEHNPMIGHRGASRYVHEIFKECFRLECRAIKLARSWGLYNIVPMIPFVRTPKEAIEVKKLMAEEGLIQEEVVQGVMERYQWPREKILMDVQKEGLVREAVFDFLENSEGIHKENGPETGLKIYMMAEIPSNVILADEFCRLFDGFSIGSNDLTQLVFGADRDNEILARSGAIYGYVANHEAIKRFIQQLLDTAHGYRTSDGSPNPRKVGICGQAPSDYPDFLQFLVSNHIDSISLNFDTYAKGRVNCFRTEIVEEKVPPHLRDSCYELLNSYDALLEQMRIPRGRMRFIKSKLEAQGTTDQKVWDVVAKFEELSEEIEEKRVQLVKDLESGRDFNEIAKEHEQVVRDKSKFDAAIAYSNQRWASYEARLE